MSETRLHPFSAQSRLNAPSSPDAQGAQPTRCPSWQRGCHDWHWGRRATLPSVFVFTRVRTPTRCDRVPGHVGPRSGGVSGAAL